MPKSEFLKANFAVRAACGDMICAVENKTSALQGLSFTPANDTFTSILTPRPRHVGIAAILLTVIAKVIHW